MNRQSAFSGEVTAVANLIADRLTVLHDRRCADEFSPPGDVDCAAVRIDPFWPLRLQHGWQICQSLHYDVCAWYWVLEREGEVLCLDTLDDPRGLGRDAFPSTLAFPAGVEPTPGVAVAPPAVVAAYLTLKRIRKQIRSPVEWRRVGLLASDDPRTYADVLTAVLGSSLASLLSEAVIGATGPPPEVLWRRARSRQRARRFSSPARAALVPTLQARRFGGRFLRPTGLTVVVAGPDGVGKSTLAKALAEDAGRLFRRSARRHWRAGVLPRPGALLGKPVSDVSRPHARTPHGLLLSVALTFYYWVDFLIGHLLHGARFKARTGLMVIERGWWDLAVDPVRYRIRAPRLLFSALGRLLPRNDLTLVLTAPETTIRERKQELSTDELVRQQRSWREAMPARETTVFLDAARTEREVLEDARSEVVSLLEERTFARLGAGWVSLPNRARPRWLLPRGPRHVARNALDIYNPHTARGRLGWELARAFASVGGFRLLAVGEAPPKALRDELAPHLPPRSTFALAKANHPGRFIALILHETGRPYAFAKLATDNEGQEGLRREAEALESHARRLPPPLVAPRIIARAHAVLLLEPAQWRPRGRPWVLPVPVAYALGTFFKSTVTEENGSLRGYAHGDFAPWNLLQTNGGWVVVDWEASWPAAPPYFDLFHYFVQSHALLGHPQADEILKGLKRRGVVGDAVDAYSAGAGLDWATAPSHFAEYLRSASAYSYTRKSVGPVGREGIRIRERLLRDLGQQ